MAITIGAASKDTKLKINLADKPRHNILRLFVTLPNFLFTTNVTKRG